MEIQWNNSFYFPDDKLSDVSKVPTLPLKWQMRDGRKIHSHSQGVPGQSLSADFWEALEWPGGRGRLGSRGRCFQPTPWAPSRLHFPRSLGSARAKEEMTPPQSATPRDQTGSRQDPTKEDDQKVSRKPRLRVPGPFFPPASADREPATLRPPRRTLSPTRLPSPSTPNSEPQAGSASPPPSPDMLPWGQPSPNWRMEIGPATGSQTRTYRQVPWPPVSGPPAAAPGVPPSSSQAPIKGVRARAPHLQDSQSKRGSGVTRRSGSPPISVRCNVSARLHVSPRCSGRLVFSVLKAVMLGLTFYVNS